MDEAIYAARFVHYTAALQLFGVAAFQSAMAPAPLRQALHPASRRIAVWSSLLLLLSGIAWLAVTAGGMAGGWGAAVDPAILVKVLAATSFGQIWGPRLVLLVLVAACALAVRPQRLWAVLAVLSGLALASLGFIGHAAAGTGIELLVHQASQVLHLLGSAFWVGSLLPLVFCLDALRRPETSAAADLALRRFSGLGHFAVAVAIGTGVLNSWFILRQGGVDLASPYQGLLTVKIVLVAVMIGLALVNRYVFVPRIPAGPGLAELRRGTIAEIALGAGVLGVIGVLGTLPPG